MKLANTRLTWKIWTWPRTIRQLKYKLASIHEVSSVYYNDSKFVTITKIIEE